MDLVYARSLCVYQPIDVWAVLPLIPSMHAMLNDRKPILSNIIYFNYNSLIIRRNKTNETLSCS